MAAILDHGDDGQLIRKTGVMAIVITDGDVGPGTAIRIEFPAEPYRPLAPV